MEKIKSYKDFKKGEIYNRVYVGTEKAYLLSIKGKETFQVIEIEPELQIQVIFDDVFGSVYSSDLRGSIITISSPEKVFQEFEISKPVDKSEWFVKSMKMESISEAITAGFIELKEIENKEIKSRRLVTCWDLGVYLKFYIEKSIPTNPYLQNVIVLWKTWNEARADLAKYGAKIIE